MIESGISVKVVEMSFYRRKPRREENKETKETILLANGKGGLDVGANV